MIVVILILKLLIRVIPIEQMSTHWKSMLVMTKAVCVSVVVVGGHLVPVKVTVTRLVKSGDNIFFVVILEGAYGW